MKTFEDLEVWQLAKSIALNVYSIENTNYTRDFGFKDQIQRAAISAMNNIAEGFERGSNKDFIKFLYYSKGSVGELRSLLRIAVELKYLEQAKYKILINNAIKLSKQLSSFIKHLSQKLK